MTGWLIDTLLYTGLLIGLVLAARKPAGRWLGPQFAYMLWALPFLRLLLPPIVLPASYAPAMEPARAAAASVPAAVDWAEITTANDLATAPLPDYAAVAETAALPSAAWTWPDVAAVGLSIWLGIALAFLGWRVVTYRRMRRELLAGARPVGEAGKVRLVETPAVAAPVAFGVLDKVIALPPLFMAQPDRLGRDLAIEHELAHHRGNDLLANFAAQALLALHWFNPLAWLGWRAMRRDQEAACDARVLAGRCREERARYAALIAGAAAGPRAIEFRGALAAPMAGPLGEKSIIHRLRSLTMSDVTPRRRWLGRGLLAASALALPLTASYSYAAGNAEQPASPPQPTALSGTVAAPLAPLAPVALTGAEGTLASRLTLAAALQGEGAAPVVPASPIAPIAPLAPIAPNAVPAAPNPPYPPLVPLPPMPNFDVNFDSEEFEARMEEFSERMEEWGERYGEQIAAQAEAQAAAWEAAGRNAPEVVESCDAGERARTRTSDGRPRIVICQRAYQLAARNGLRQARAAIASNRAISEDVRDEIVDQLDEEIDRLDSDAE